MSPGVWHWCCCGGGWFGSLFCGSCHTTDQPVLAYWDGSNWQDDLISIPLISAEARAFHPMRANPTNGYPVILIEQPGGLYDTAEVWRYDGANWACNGVAIGHGGSGVVYSSLDIYDLRLASNGYARILSYGEDLYYVPSTRRYAILAEDATGYYTETELGAVPPFCLCVKGDDNVGWALWDVTTTLYCGPSGVAAESIADEGGGADNRYAVTSSPGGTLYVMATANATRVYERTGIGTYTQREIVANSSTNCDLIVAGGKVHCVYKRSSKYWYAVATEGEWSWDIQEVYTDTPGVWGRASIAVMNDGTVNIIIGGVAGFTNYTILAIYSNGASWEGDVVTRTDQWHEGGRVYLATPYHYP